MLAPSTWEIIRELPREELSQERLHWQHVCALDVELALASVNDGTHGSFARRNDGWVYTKRG
jgi:hypothetical protein